VFSVTPGFLCASALRFRRTTRSFSAKQKCEHGHVIVCLWYKLEICSGPPLSPSRNFYSRPRTWGTHESIMPTWCLKRLGRGPV